MLNDNYTFLCCFEPFFILFVFISFIFLFHFLVLKMPTPRRLTRILEQPHQEELLSKTWEDFSYPPEFLSKKWEDFDHSQTLSLGEWRSTWIVHERRTLNPYILQSCPEDDWTISREKLLALAMQDSLFITPRYQFCRPKRIFVCSDIADTGICLADLISCTIPMTESHASSVMKQESPSTLGSENTSNCYQVLNALKAVAAKNLVYTSLRASNVFVSREGKVRLGK